MVERLVLLLPGCTLSPYSSFCSEVSLLTSGQGFPNFTAHDPININVKEFYFHGLHHALMILYCTVVDIVLINAIYLLIL